MSSYIRFYLKATRNANGQPVVREYFECERRDTHQPAGLVDDGIRKAHAEDYDRFQAHVKANVEEFYARAVEELEREEGKVSPVKEAVEELEREEGKVSPVKEEGTKES